MSQTSQEGNDYLSQLEPKRLEMLATIRSVIFEEVPGDAETMKYHMPTYERDEMMLAVASQKHYVSLYMDTELVAKYGDELSHLNCGKSCIRFKNLEELPIDTICKIIQETLEKQES